MSMGHLQWKNMVIKQHTKTVLLQKGPWNECKDKRQQEHTETQCAQVCHCQYQEIIKDKVSDRPPEVPTQWFILLRIKFVTFFLFFNLPNSWDVESNYVKPLLQGRLLLFALARAHPVQSSPGPGSAFRSQAPGPPLSFTLCALPFAQHLPQVSLERLLYFLSLGNNHLWANWNPH